MAFSSAFSSHGARNAALDADASVIEVGARLLCFDSGSIRAGRPDRDRSLTVRAERLHRAGQLVCALLPLGVAPISFNPRRTSEDAMTGQTGGR